MMFSSLPDYGRFSDAALERLSEGRSTADRIAGMLFNLAILAGLWGAPLYARSVVLADIQARTGLRDSIHGTWRTTDGSRFVITFTEQREFLVSWKGRLIDSTRFWIDEQNPNVVLLAHVEEQIRDHKRVLVNCGFRGSLKEDRLFISNAGMWIRPGHVWEVEGERLKLPRWNGQPLVLERVK